MNGKAPKMTYTVNGTEYDTCYWLADGIYPEYPCFVKTISHPVGNKSKNFAKVQKVVEKMSNAVLAFYNRAGILSVIHLSFGIRTP